MSNCPNRRVADKIHVIMKKFTFHIVRRSLMLLAVALASALGSRALSQTSATIHGINYNLYDDDNTAGIRSVDYEATLPVNFTVPSTVEHNGVTYTVTTIGQSAFQNQQFTSVTIPATIQKIDNEAFYFCRSLTTFTIEDGDTELLLDTETFSFHSDDNHLKTLHIGRPLSFTGHNYNESPFSRKENLETVTFGNSVTTVNDNMFSDCTNLSSVTLGSGITKIGESAFRGTALASIDIPASVTKINNSAFNGCSDLTAINVNSGNSIYSSYDGVLYNIDQTIIVVFPAGKTTVTLPSTVANLKSDAFANSKLQSITLPNTLTVINSGLFSGCSDLTSIDIPSSVTQIGESAFASTGLQKVTIPASVKSIDHGAFYRCTNLKEFVIADREDSIYISSDVFYHYGYFDDENIPKTAIETLHMGGYIIPTEDRYNHYPNIIFSESPLKNITFGSSVTGIAGKLFYGCKDLTTVKLPETISNIGAYAFKGSGLTSIEIPNSVETIGDLAFSSTALASIEIPASVTSIGVGLIAGCPNLATITVDAGNTVYSAVDNILYLINRTDQVLMACPATKTSVSIPGTVTTIAPYAFYGCLNFNSFELPDNVMYIGEYAFAGCSNLTKIVLGTGIGYIGDDAFSGVPLAEIQCKASRCPRLNNSIEYIFPAVDLQLCKLVVPSRYINSYKQNYYWSGFQNITGEEFDDMVILVESIEINTEGLPTTLRIGESVQYPLVITPEDANEPIYWQSSSPEKVSVDKDGKITVLASDNYPRHGIWAFTKYVTAEGYQMAVYDNVEITLSGEIMTYEIDGLFYSLDKDNNTATVFYENKNTVDNWEREELRDNYAALTEVVIPSTVTFDGETYTVTAIGEYAFNHCSKLTSVSIPESVTSINQFAFYGCSSLTSVELPAAIVELSPLAFAYCSDLTEIKVKAGNTAFSSIDGVVYGNNNTELIAFPAGKETVSIPQSVTAIGNYAFAGSRIITEIDVPDNVKTIGKYAFTDCFNLKQVTLGTGLEKIDTAAFYLVRWIGDERQHIYDNMSVNKVVCKATVPPVCENSALYHIDKIRCTLVVPTEALTAYKSAPQWRKFYTITDNGEIIFESISITSDYDLTQVKVGETIQLKAKIKSATATEDDVVWSSSDETIAAIDEKGLVTALAEGTVTITAETNDGSDLKATTNIIIVKQTTTGLDNDALGQTTIFAADGQIHINNIPLNTRISLYTTSGTLIHSSIATSTTITLQAERHTLYLLRLDHKTHKVLLP